MSENEEIDLICRILDGDIDAFSLLIRAYQDGLVRMLATLLGDKRRFAEDVAQDVFVEAYRRLGDYDPARSKFSTWLYMIGRSRGINALKRKRPLLYAEPPEEVVVGVTMSDRGDLGVLDNALHDLPIKQKRAFTLAVIEDLPYAEVARMESTTVGTIKSRVSRAREYLKITLEEANK